MNVYIVWRTQPNISTFEDKIKIEGIFKDRKKAYNLAKCLSKTVDSKFGLAIEVWRLDD